MGKRIFVCALDVHKGRIYATLFNGKAREVFGTFTSQVKVPNENFSFVGEEVTGVPTPGLGKWHMDKNGGFYKDGGLDYPK
jgi:hypothetical protein